MLASSRPRPSFYLLVCTMSRSLLLSFFTVFVSALNVLAQSDASCLPYYNWAFNSQKNSPCEVASLLLAVCNNGSFPVDPLPDSSHYNGPSIKTANPCQCNTVTYSLMSACGACQGRSYLSWSVWSGNCATVSTGTYPEPIPSGLSVPGWAYQDVKAHDTFDQSNARDHANATESTAVPSPSSSPISVSSTRALPSSSEAPASSPTESASAAVASSFSRHANAIGGGVAGGLFGLMLIAAGIGCFIHYRKKRQAKIGKILDSPPDAEKIPLPSTGHKEAGFKGEGSA